MAEPAAAAEPAPAAEPAAATEPATEPKAPAKRTRRATSKAAAPTEQPAADAVPAAPVAAEPGTTGVPDAAATESTSESVTEATATGARLDVLAELAPVARAASTRRRSRRTAEPAAPSGDEPETTALTEPVASEVTAPAVTSAVTVDGPETSTDEDAEETTEVTGGVTADASAAPQEPTPAPRLASSAVLFQPPKPVTTRAGRRRVVAQAGPPQFIVPETITPDAPRGGEASAAPQVTVTTSEGPSAPIAAPVSAPAAPVGTVADEPAAGEPRRRSRRASRPTAAPAPVVPAPAAEVTTPVRDEPTATDTDTEDQAVDAPRTGRRGSRRRGSSRALDAVQELLGETPTRDAVDEGGADLEADEDAIEDREALLTVDGSAVDTAVEPDEDEDDDETTDGGPRRRRRRGGRGRRSRAGGDADASRTPLADDADEDDDEDAAGAETEGDEEPTEGDEGTGSSRRRRRRRRSGRGTEGVEAEAVAPVAARVRAPRAPSDEVTALRGSTRLEAKRQRRREGRDAGRRRQIITESEFLARRESVDRTMVVRELDGRTQIAVLEDGVLVEHYVSRQAQLSMAGNVYLGRVQNVLPSMEAAFVDVGKGRNAVLYAGEVNWDAAGLEGQPRRIEQALKSGDSVLVQVTKDPIGHKGARLTSQITLAGRYLVYVPGGGMTGISRKLPDNERARLKKLLREIVPDTAGVIVRTAAEGASEDELRADIQRLQDQWTAIEKKAKTASAPALLQGEPDMAIRVVRDIFNDDFGSLVVQGDEAWETISGYIGALAPDLAQKVSRWTAEGDVFSAHRVDEQLAKGMDRKVWLPSGGSLVIDRTEAMTVVDVNTGKFTGSGGTLEETVTRNNLEAAEEIVRQLRLRDIGGIIVIDFIDMVLETNRDLVLRRLVECLGRDRTKHQVAEVTSLGLVQMTRKRVGQGLVEAFSETCEHCNGRGFIVHTDPVEGSNGAPAPAPQGASQQSVTTGDDSKRASSRRKRGTGKEQGSATTTAVPALPVLPEAREAVKATLATIAAAAAHAHEHNGHGHATAAPDVAVPATPASGPTTPVDGGSGLQGGIGSSDVVAAVSEALDALREAHPAASPASVAEPGVVAPGLGEPDLGEPGLTEPDLAQSLATAAHPDVAPADLEPTVEEVLAVEDVADEVVADAAGDPLAGLPADELGAQPTETLVLVPVAADVFDLSDDESDDVEADDVEPDDAGSVDVLPDAGQPPVAGEPVGDEPLQPEEEQVSPPDLGEPVAPDLGDVVEPDEPADD
nr:ribonuclease E/G [Cellulomonas aerilata]